MSKHGPIFQKFQPTMEWTSVGGRSCCNFTLCGETASFPRMTEVLFLMLTGKIDRVMILKVFICSLNLLIFKVEEGCGLNN